MKLTTIKKAIKHTLHPNGGGITIDNNGIEYTPDTGYFVSLAGGLEIPAYDINNPTAYRTITAWVNQRKSYFNTGCYLGFWLNPDNNIVYIDITKHRDTLTSAMRIARDNKQLAIYDCKAGKAIPVKTQEIK